MLFKINEKMQKQTQKIYEINAKTDAKADAKKNERPKFQNFKKNLTCKATKKSKPVWEKKRPASLGKSEKLSPAQKASAKAAAKGAATLAGPTKRPLRSGLKLSKDAASVPTARRAQMANVKPTPAAAASAAAGNEECAWRL